MKTIRSFVRREGRMTPAQRAFLEEAWPRYGLEPVPGTSLDPRTCFAHPAPVRLEIGFGMGHSLFEMAKQCPDENFIGVEVYRPGVGHLLRLLSGAEVENVRVLCVDAAELITSILSPASLARIQIYFPDPWPKKRHHKRRLIQPEFVGHCVRCLEPGGIVHLATDWTHYADHMLEVLSACPDLDNLADEEWMPARWERAETKYERRAIEAGRKIYDLAFRKIRPVPAGR